VYTENVTQWEALDAQHAGGRYDAYRFNVASSIDSDSGKASNHIVSPKLSLISGRGKTEYFVDYGKGFHSNDTRHRTNPLSGCRACRDHPWPATYPALWRLDINSELPSSVTPSRRKQTASAAAPTLHGPTTISLRRVCCSS
jgi:hypothetical protein